MNTRNLLVSGAAAAVTFATALGVTFIHFSCSMQLLSFHLWEEMGKACALVLLFAALPLALVSTLVAMFAKASRKGVVCAVLCSSMFALLVGSILALHDELSFLHANLPIKEVMPGTQDDTRYEEGIKAAPRMGADNGSYCLRKTADGCWHILLWD